MHFRNCFVTGKLEFMPKVSRQKKLSLQWHGILFLIRGRDRKNQGPPIDRLAATWCPSRDERTTQPPTIVSWCFRHLRCLCFKYYWIRHWMTPDFIGTVEALLILRRWMKMTTTIFDNSQGCDLCQGKNSKDGRDHHHHPRDYCRDHHRFKGFLGPPAGAELPASSSSSGRWESLLSSAVHRTDSLLPRRQLTNRCNKMHLCALQLNKFSSSSLCFPKRNRDSDAKRVCSFWESEASPSHCRPCRGQKIHDSEQPGTIQEALSETEGKKT